MKKTIIVILVLMFFFVSQSHNTLSLAATLPNNVDELLSLDNEILQKLCNTGKNVYQFGLGTYHCPDDLAPGSYIIYIFSNHEAAFYNTTLRFKDAAGVESKVLVGNLSMATIKITVKEGSDFSLLQDDDYGYFGVVCYIAPWTKIGE